MEIEAIKGVEVARESVTVDVPPPQTDRGRRGRAALEFTLRRWP